MKYTEVNFILKNDDVVIQPTGNRLESNGQTIITEIDFQREKDSIKSDLLKQEKSVHLDDETTSVTTKYRKRR
jgi:hypothetical protein